MKKLLIISLILGTAIVFTPAVQANTTSSAAFVETEQSWRGEQRRGRGYNRRYNNRRISTYTTTRIVRSWGRLYRETIRVTRYPNGRTRTQVIRRVRIR